MNFLKFFSIFFVVLFSFANLSAESLKVGVFDMQKIIDESQKGEKAKALLKKISEKMQEEIVKLKENGEELEKEIKSQYSVLSEAKKEEKIRKLRILENDFEYFKKKFTSNIKQKEAEISKGIHKDVIRIAKNIGKAQKYSLIVEKREAGLIYFDKSYDLTNQIIKKYDREK